MKKRRYLVLFVALLIFLAACGGESYDDIVSGFTTISTKKLEEKVGEGEELYVYVGRKDCPYCQKFVPVLKEVAKTKDLKIYYIDTNVDPDIDAFAEKLGMEYVPSLLYVKEGDIRMANIGDTYSEDSVTKAIDQIVQ